MNSALDPGSKAGATGVVDDMCPYERCGSSRCANDNPPPRGILCVGVHGGKRGGIRLAVSSLRWFKGWKCHTTSLGGLGAWYGSKKRAAQ